MSWEKRERVGWGGGGQGQGQGEGEREFETSFGSHGMEKDMCVEELETYTALCRTTVTTCVSAGTTTRLLLSPLFAPSTTFCRTLSPPVP